MYLTQTVYYGASHRKAVSTVFETQLCKVCVMVDFGIKNHSNNIVKKLLLHHITFVLPLLLFFMGFDLVS